MRKSEKKIIEVTGSHFSPFEQARLVEICQSKLKRDTSPNPLTFENSDGPVKLVKKLR